MEKPWWEVPLMEKLWWKEWGLSLFESGALPASCLSLWS